MLSVSLDLGRVPSVLAALADQRNAALAAKVAAESFVDDVHDWIDAGNAFTPGQGGGLEQSINWRRDGNGGATISVLDRNRTETDSVTGYTRVVNAKNYAPFVEFGTRRHVISPKPGRKGLKIPVADGSGYVVRRSVIHPGSRPHPFFFADLDNRTAHMQERALSVLAARMA